MIQPFVPHYREDFFKLLGTKVNNQIYSYENKNKISNKAFKTSSLKSDFIKNFQLGPFLLYDITKIIRKDTDVLVLMLHFGHLSTWILLFTKIFHRKKIILWGQGISVKRYLKEEQKPDILLRWMISLSDGVWLYTQKELKQWQEIFPNKKMVSLNNTISSTDEILAIKKTDEVEKDKLRKKYGIVEPIILIFCARFNQMRRIDLLMDVIKSCDKERFGFIVIGDGEGKPSFAPFNNVYDFGMVYEFSTKTDLFSIADIYFQPAWLGLSVVEAMAYGKPVFSFKRSEKVLQCVEYYYVQDNFNGKIFNDVKEMICYLNEIELDAVVSLGKNAKKYVQDNLSMDTMVTNALTII